MNSMATSSYLYTKISFELGCIMSWHIRDATNFYSLWGGDGARGDIVDSATFGQVANFCGVHVEKAMTAGCEKLWKLQYHLIP